jgi:hypothetical protein
VGSGSVIQSYGCIRTKLTRIPSTVLLLVLLSYSVTATNPHLKTEPRQKLVDFSKKAASMKLTNYERKHLGKIIKLNVVAPTYYSS